LRRAETVAWPPGSFPMFWWQGTLYLTDRRLIWRRYLLGYIGPSLLDIPLDTIDQCSVHSIGPLGAYVEMRSARTSIAIRPFRHGCSLSALRTVVRNTTFAQDLTDAIDEARGRAASSVSDQGG
jgi:hypothetical protein